MADKRIYDREYLEKRFGSYGEIVPAFYDEISKYTPEIKDDLASRILRTKLHFKDLGQTYGDTVSFSINGKHYSKININTHEEKAIRKRTKIKYIAKAYFDEDFDLQDLKKTKIKNVAQTFFDDSFAVKDEPFKYYDVVAEKNKTLASTFIHEMLHAISGVQIERFKERNYIYDYVGPLQLRRVYAVRYGNVSYQFYDDFLTRKTTNRYDPIAMWIEEGIVADFENDLADKILPLKYGNYEISSSYPEIASFCGMWNVVSGDILRREFLLGESLEKQFEQENSRRYLLRHINQKLHVIKNDEERQREIKNLIRASRETRKFKQILYDYMMLLDTDDKIKIKDIDIEQVAKCNKALVEMCDRFYNSRLLHNPTPEQVEKYLRLRDYVKSGEHVTVFFDRELKKVSKNERKEFYNNLKGQIVAQFENENPKNIWKDKLRDFLFDANGRISVAPEHVSRR